MRLEFSDFKHYLKALLDDEHVGPLRLEAIKSYFREVVFKATKVKLKLPADSTLRSWLADLVKAGEAILIETAEGRGKHHYWTSLEGLERYGEEVREA